MHTDERFNIPGKILSGSLDKKSYNDAGLDICAAEDVTIFNGQSALVPTGTVIAIPSGCVGLLWPRSGLSVKHQIEVGAGCIDSSYRGEVKVHLYNHGNSMYKVNKGDRIAQLLTIPINSLRYTKVEKLTETNRGENGFGASGK